MRNNNISSLENIADFVLNNLHFDIDNVRKLIGYLAEDQQKKGIEILLGIEKKPFLQNKMVEHQYGECKKYPTHKVEYNPLDDIVKVYYNVPEEEYVPFGFIDENEQAKFIADIQKTSTEKQFKTLIENIEKTTDKKLISKDKSGRHKTNILAEKSQKIYLSRFQDLENVPTKVHIEDIFGHDKN